MLHIARDTVVIKLRRVNPKELLRREQGYLRLRPATCWLAIGLEQQLSASSSPAIIDEGIRTAL